MQPVMSRWTNEGKTVFQGGLKEGKLHYKGDVLVDTGEMNKFERGRVVVEGVEAVGIAVAIVMMVAVIVVLIEWAVGVKMWRIREIKILTTVY